MVKITHIPEAIYCGIQSRTSHLFKFDRCKAYEWKGQIHKYYDVFLEGDFMIICQNDGLINIARPGHFNVTLYPDEFQEIIFR